MFRRNCFVVVAMAATFCLLGSTAQSEVPYLMNYSGTLTNGAGTPQVGTFNVTFIIYDAPVGGAPQWFEVQSVTTDSQGRFAVLLGSTGGFSSLGHGVFAGPDRYLGITVSPDPEMTPRTRISTVGYAFRSATLDNVSIRTQNTLIGEGAGNPTMSGFGITAIGHGALASSTTGEANTAVGQFALTFNQDGSDNCALGQSALRQNSSGYHNSAIGKSAMYNNTTGYKNTASGYAALGSNTTGHSNTADGAEALAANGAGFFNSALGYQASRDNVDGDYNTACGAFALAQNTSSGGNTASGYSALSSTTTGYGNTAIGFLALRDNTGGYENAASGYGALSYSTTGLVNTAHGSNALSFNSTGSYNTATGGDALLYNYAGDHNTACGHNALASAESTSYNSAFGANANVADGANNSTAIGANAFVNASNKVRLGDGLVTVIEGQVAYTFTSDKNSKENFREVDGDEVLQKLRDLEVQSWNYKGHDPEHFRHYGPVAQDFYAAFGHDGVGTSGTSTTINSGDMAGILMIAVQELEKRTAENEDLRTRVEALERSIRELAKVK